MTVLNNTDITREPMYFQDGADALFGWYHSAGSAPQQDCVAVVCNAIGHEYTHSHRSMRHLADRLARQGVPALRFDYHGTGDSPGTDLDADRWGSWQRNIQAAIRTASALSGRQRICLIGVRLGATLAALAAGERKVDLLVLWNPCVRGHLYLRELRAIASTSRQGAVDDRDRLEAAGFVLSAQTVAALRGVNLLERTFDARRTLLVERDDLAADDSLSRHLAACGITHDRATASGYAGMMAEHQFSVVPEAALNTIAGWVAANTTPCAPGSAHAVRPSVTREIHPESANGAASIREELCRFGHDEHLFGVLSQSVHASNLPAVVLFNAGSVHHIGPNRLSVMLARELAAAGFACLRFDLEGIGDSVLRGPGRENHPYPQTARADARAAFDHLSRHFGHTRFIAMGLCSGAHTAFHAALDLDQYEITDLVLINPLTFYWAEGMSLETSAHFRDALSYQKSMRKLSRWVKLLRGQVDLRNLFRVALSCSKSSVQSIYQAFCEALLPQRASRLSRDLKRLFEMNCAISLLVAEGDPAREILMAGARFTATRALKTGKIRLQTFAGADHTFTQHERRKDLIAAIRTVLQESANTREHVSAAGSSRRGATSRQRMVARYSETA